jgi:hypothetical protein
MRGADGAPHLSSCAILAPPGFDLAVIDTEHGIADGGELEHHLRAADSAGMERLIRVGGHDATEILCALTPEQALQDVHLRRRLGRRLLAGERLTLHQESVRRRA